MSISSLSASTAESAIGWGSGVVAQAARNTIGTILRKNFFTDSMLPEAVRKGSWVDCLQRSSGKEPGFDTLRNRGHGRAGELKRNAGRRWGRANGSAAHSLSNGTSAPWPRYDTLFSRMTGIPQPFGPLCIGQPPTCLTPRSQWPQRKFRLRLLPSRPLRPWREALLTFVFSSWSGRPGRGHGLNLD